MRQIPINIKTPKAGSVAFVDICIDLDDPLAGLAAKFCMMGASNDPLDRAIYTKLTFEEFARIGEWIRPDAESVKRRPRD